MPPTFTEDLIFYQGATFDAAMTQDAAIYQAAETHRAAMEAAADPLTYNYLTGWPAVYPGVA